MLAGASFAAAAPSAFRCWMESAGMAKQFRFYDAPNFNAGGLWYNTRNFNACRCGLWFNTLNFTTKHRLRDVFRLSRP